VDGSKKYYSFLIDSYTKNMMILLVIQLYLKITSNIFTQSEDVTRKKHKNNLACYSLIFNTVKLYLYVVMS
jgi:hypothetical protein